MEFVLDPSGKSDRGLLWSNFRFGELLCLDQFHVLDVNLRVLRIMPLLSCITAPLPVVFFLLWKFASRVVVLVVTAAPSLSCVVSWQRVESLSFLDVGCLLLSFCLLLLFFFPVIALVCSGCVFVPCRLAFFLPLLLCV